MKPGRPRSAPETVRRGRMRPWSKMQQGVCATTAVLVVCLATTPARAQPTEPATKTAAKVPISDVVRRAVSEGCAPAAVNAAIDNVAFGSLAAWLEARERPIEAHRVRAMMQLETEHFASMRDQVEQIIATQVFTNGRGGRWDADRNLSLAATLLGGTDNLIRYVTAARAVHLAIYERPSRSLFATPTPPFDRWARDGEPQSGMVALKTDMTSATTRASFQIPINVSRYILQGAGYTLPFTPYPEAVVSVNAEALATVARARSEAVQALVEGDAPLRRSLVAKLSRPQDEVPMPTDDGDLALTYAAWLPSLCLGYQHMLTPLWFSQRVVDELYIAPLKAKGSW